MPDPDRRVDLINYLLPYIPLLLAFRHFRRSGKVMGDPAYNEARERARSCRVKNDRVGDEHWTRVAVEIAKRTGHRIGER